MRYQPQPHSFSFSNHTRSQTRSRSFRLSILVLKLVLVLKHHLLITSIMMNVFKESQFISILFLYLTSYSLQSVCIRVIPYIFNYMQVSHYHSPADRWVRAPLQRFISNSSAGGLMLFGSAFLALLAANSPWAHAYHEIWEIPFSIGIGEAVLKACITGSTMA